MFVLASLVNFYGGDLAVDYQKYFVTLLIYNVYHKLTGNSPCFPKQVLIFLGTKIDSVNRFLNH